MQARATRTAGVYVAIGNCSSTVCLGLTMHGSVVKLADTVSYGRLVELSACTASCGRVCAGRRALTVVRGQAVAGAGGARAEHRLRIGPGVVVGAVTLTFTPQPVLFGCGARNDCSMTPPHGAVTSRCHGPSGVGITIEFLSLFLSVNSGWS